MPLENDGNVLDDIIIQKHVRCVEDEEKPCAWSWQYGIWTSSCDYPSSHTIPCSEKDDPEHKEYCEGKAFVCCYHSEVHAQSVANLN